MGEHHEVLGRAGEVARRHGVDPAQVHEVAGGVASRAFVLGEKLFLRVCRPGFEADLRKEIRVVPAARSVGVLTPAIIEYDDSRRLIATPYVVTERVHGTEPTDLPTGLAEQLARLHHLDPSDGLLTVPEDDWADPWRTVDDLGSRGYIDPGTANWLTGWFTRLADRIDRTEPKVLIHGDVAAHNLLAGPANELRALIDWGDAAWAPRAMDFAKLPLTQVARLLPDYLHHTETNDSGDTKRSGFTHAEEDLAAAILWFHLHWALARIPSTPDPCQRHWTAPTASRLLNLLHFFSTAPPAPWSRLA